MIIKSTKKMEKKELKNKIDSKINEILESTEKENTRKLIDELLSLKGQYDVVPMVYGIEASSVKKEYDFGAGKFIMTRKGIIYHLKGGMAIMVTPRMTAVYRYLLAMLSLKDRYDKLNKDEKEAYDYLFLGITTVFNLPIYAVCDDTFMANVVKYIFEQIDVMFKKFNDMPLQDETSEEDAAFENEMDMWHETSKLK